jgi:hypothetical protein
MPDIPFALEGLGKVAVGEDGGINGAWTYTWQKSFGGRV